MANKINGIPVAPLTGVLDVRSSPDAMPANSLRMRQNLQTVADGKLRRGTGWQKAFSGAITPYNNQDLHDQLLIFTGGVPRQPVTLLFEAESTRRVRHLLAAKQGAIFELNEWSGNWLVLGSGYGGTEVASAAATRFYATQLGDYLILTNDFDRPMVRLLEGASMGDPLLEDIPDLATIGLSRAAVCWTWANCVFLADVEMDGQRFAYRLLWSNFLDPTGFDPGKVDSITGFKDLYTHERILAGRPTANSFLIYTTHGIWEMAVVGGEQSFAFVRRYNGEQNQGAGVLKYRNTLTALPDGHIYAAEDGLYSYSPYYLKPERLEWLHRSSGVLFDEIDEAHCDVHIGVMSRNELLLSFARKGAPNFCPDITLRTNMTYRVADVIDTGFTAFANYRSFRVPTIRDFIIERRICTLQGLADAGYPFGNEGLPNPLPEGTADFEPKSIYTLTPQTIGDVTTEDWEQAEADSDSLCALLGDFRMDELCRQCEGDTLLLAVSSRDWCIKQLGEVFYRERCTNPTAAGSTTGDGYASASGTFLLEGLDSILRFAPLYGPKNDPNRSLVKVSSLTLDAIAMAQADPSVVSLRVGVSGMVADPNIEQGRIVWFQHSDQLLKWLTALTVAQHKARGTVPADLIGWRFERKGRVLYLELKIGGTGGDCELSGVVAEAELQAAQNY